MSKRLIIDVTELYTWQGRLTGVPRVMHELAVRFAGHPDNYFVFWDAAEHAYRQVNHVELTNIQPQQNAVVVPVVSSSRTLRVVKKVKNSAPLISKSVDFARNKFQATLLTSADQTFAITPKDCLLILADWHGADVQFIEYVKTLKQKGAKLVQVCYDMLPIVTPQYSGHATESFKRYVTEVYPLCDEIVSISEHTKQDISRWFKKNHKTVPQTSVMRLGDDFKKSRTIMPNNSSFAANEEVQDGFILCVGTIEARKNHAILYYAYKRAAQLGVNLPPLVVVGRVGWLANDIHTIMTTDPEVKENIIFLNNASDEELAWLYEHCLFTVYPSFYEGWGLPVAESVAYGVPCLASKTSSIPEIAGDLITYFDPSSSDECLQGMLRLCDPKQRTSIKQKLSQYHPHSWDETFETLNDQLGAHRG